VRESNSHRVDLFPRYFQKRSRSVLSKIRVRHLLKSTAGAIRIATGCHTSLNPALRQFGTYMARHSTGRSQKLVYINSEKFLELVAHLQKTEREFRASAGISKELFDRLIRYGGPVQLSTLTKITTALRVSVTSLIDQRRRRRQG
jgi:DNA-binding Xre family transcriptional regulator